ncbi:MAG: hypothetical protein IPN29_20410 [Saprospiraceae bacterium]|nr:hypothetical protein [Saprospiraceae bacterium]
MRNNILLTVILGIVIPNLKAQVYVSTPLKEHQAYFEGLVEKRKGNCDLANQFFNQEKSDTCSLNHDLWRGKAEGQMVQCVSPVSAPAFTANITRAKIRKSRNLNLTTKNSETAKISTTEVEDKPVPETKVVSHAVTNTKPHFRVKLGESAIPDKSFISLADLGPVYSEEVNGIYSYFIAAPNKEEKAYELATKIKQRTITEPIIEQCSKGAVVKSFTVKEFSELPSVKLYIKANSNKNEVAKEEKSENNFAPGSKGVQSYIVVESLSDLNRVKVLQSKLEKMGYDVKTERYGVYTRVGVVPKQGQDLDALLGEIRQNLNSKAWIRI